MKEGIEKFRSKEIQDQAPEVQFNGTVVKFTSDYQTDGMATEFIIDQDKPVFQLIEGQESYYSHTAYKNGFNEYVFAHPFESQFYFDRDVSWPRLIFNLNRLDYSSKIDTCGHTILYLPKTPGFHTMTAKVFKFCGSNVQELNAAQLGQNQTNEFDWKKTWMEVGANDRKQQYSTTQVGEITVECEVIIRNADLYGFDNCVQGTSKYRTKFLEDLENNQEQF